MSNPDLIGFLKAAYPNGSWPRPFHVLEGLQRVAAGESSKDAAKAVGTSAHLIEKAQKSRRPEFEILGVQPSDLTEEDMKKAGVILGQLLIGRTAEIAFEDIYRQEIGADVEFKLVDLREGRTDTDYRVLNGRDRPIYRVNIKFVGSTFRRAVEMVGLEPDDCFPLATYKIFGALQKQEKEHLPYIFAIVGVPNLTAASIQDQLPTADLQIVALLVSRARETSRTKWSNGSWHKIPQRSRESIIVFGRLSGRFSRRGRQTISYGRSFLSACSR
jgi:hypothetical protein